MLFTEGRSSLQNRDFFCPSRNYHTGMNMTSSRSRAATSIRSVANGVSERKHLPSRDVAAAGGWRDLRTMERSYQRADEHTLLAVVTESAKLRDA
jgi:hypothetical protein